MPVISLVILAALSWCGYSNAAKFEREHGRSPGGASPTLWAVICFVIGLFGILALYIAMRSTKKKLRNAPPAWTPVGFEAQPPGTPVYNAPVGQPYGAPPSGQWAPPPPPPGMNVPFQPGPNVGGSDFLPRKS